MSAQSINNVVEILVKKEGLLGTLQRIIAVSKLLNETGQLTKIEDPVSTDSLILQLDGLLHRTGAGLVS
jgi:hypothetical protein